MPQVQSGPKELNTLLETVYSSCIDDGNSKSYCSRIAWTAAKNAGWKQDKDDKWVKEIDNIKKSIWSDILMIDRSEKIMKLVGQTSVVDDHYHDYFIDKDNNGETTSTLGEDNIQHTHMIIGGIVQVAEDHIHEIMNKDKTIWNGVL